MNLPDSLKIEKETKVMAHLLLAEGCHLMPLTFKIIKLQARKIAMMTVMMIRAMRIKKEHQEVENSED